MHRMQLQTCKTRRCSLTGWLRLQEQVARQQKTAEAEADQMRKDMDRLRLQMSQLQNEANASAKTAEDARVSLSS